MGKTTRAGGGKAGSTRSTRPGELLLRGDRILITDGAIEFGPGGGAAMDTTIARASSGRLSLGSGDMTVDDLTVDDLTVTDAATVGGTLDVTGTLTAFGYLGVGGSAGVTAALDVAGTCAGIWGPRDNSLVACTYDPVVATSTQLLTGGSIYLAKMFIPFAATPTKLYWNVTTQATTATAGECWVSVLSSAGAVLATPVDVTTASESTGLKTTTVAPGALAANTFVWAAIVLAGSTVATLSRTAAVSGPLGAGATTAGMRFAINGTSQTTITTRTPASNTVGPSLWFALGV